MSELKPCPFCQSGNVEFKESTHWTGMRSVVIAVVIYHWCQDLPNGVKNLIKLTGRTKEDAIAAWNTRADGWIPVSERLPEDRQKVLIWWKAHVVGMNEGVWIGEYINGLDEFRPDGCMGDFRDEITHWQPLPAPPK